MLYVKKSSLQITPNVNWPKLLSYMTKTLNLDVGEGDGNRTF